MVHPKRIRQLNNSSIDSSLLGPIVYWMSRDQRTHDNWALIYAQYLAKDLNRPLVVVFCLRETFPYASERMLSFMLTGLEEVERNLAELNISFQLLLGDIPKNLFRFIEEHRVPVLVKDFTPLKAPRSWTEDLLKKTDVPVFEVDAHNVIPVWVASEKQEYAAYTMRPKIHQLLDEYLEEFPVLHSQAVKAKFSRVDWKFIWKSLEYDSNVKKVDWIKPGEQSAKHNLGSFIKLGLSTYETKRNDPLADSVSMLSPFLHFGQISPARVALNIDHSQAQAENKKVFLEELIVRRELADNFCFYNPNYDSSKGFPKWAKESLEKHESDKREYVYSLEEFKNASTHDELWNAAQKEMVIRGKMHGYMRMYWAKKILEWTKDADHAMKVAINLNDTFELDGRDPNGYTGIAWSIGGVHDRPWFERDIFGLVRFMSYNGLKSKINIKQYIERIKNYEL